jgi:hypothetical protein
MEWCGMSVKKLIVQFTRREKAFCDNQETSMMKIRTNERT